MFNYADNFQLPFTERQPGVLHFTTGLKYDIMSATQKHWQDQNGTSDVLRMLCSLLVMTKIFYAVQLFLLVSGQIKIFETNHLEY